MRVLHSLRTPLFSTFLRCRLCTRLRILPLLKIRFIISSPPPPSAPRSPHFYTSLRSTQCTWARSGSESVGIIVHRMNLRAVGGGCSNVSRAARARTRTRRLRRSNVGAHSPEAINARTHARTRLRHLTSERCSQRKGNNQGDESPLSLSFSHISVTPSHPLARPGDDQKKNKKTANSISNVLVTKVSTISPRGRADSWLCLKATCSHTPR